MSEKMTKQQAWKNFNLGDELSISGSFIYNGLRRFHEMQVLNQTDEVFEFLYNLSVGLERLLKIAVVLVEHNDAVDQTVLEKSLITHTHLELMKRVKAHASLNLGSEHNEFLAILGNFYQSIRYDRFTLSSVYDPNKERKIVCDFLSKNLEVVLEQSPLTGIQNCERYRDYIRKIVTKISSELFEVVKDKARSLNLYTYELRSGSRAETIFLGNADIPAEDVLWKELLLFFMNTKTDSGCLNFMRSIEPLEFDPELAIDYCECFRSDAAKANVIEELETLYSDLKKPGDRLKLMNLIGNPNCQFDSPDTDDTEDDAI